MAGAFVSAASLRVRVSADPSVPAKIREGGPCDYERFRKHEWFTKKGRNSFYAFRRVATGKAGKKKLTYMHREVMEVGDGKMVDHINHDGMDNRSGNLREASHSENMYHRKKCSRATHSKYKGIYWHKEIRKWQVQITCEKKKIHLGCFRDEIEAARTYDRAAMKYHGEFACLNFPDEAGAGHRQKPPNSL